MRYQVSSISGPIVTGQHGPDAPPGQSNRRYYMTQVSMDPMRYQASQVTVPHVPDQHRFDETLLISQVAGQRCDHQRLKVDWSG